MATKVDKPSRWADILTKKLFKGKKGKVFREQLLTYLKTPNPPLGPGGLYAKDLAGQLSGPTGLLSQAIGQQQAMLPQWTNAVNQGLSGNFFDIGPAQQFAERGLRRETIPTISQTFSTLGSPLSSDTTGQITNAVRDTYLDLAAQDALMEFQAKQGLVNQGGLTSYFNAVQQPSNLALGGAEQLSNLDAAQRSAQQSTMPGAASLYPSFLSSGLEPLSQISSRGRTIAEV